mmetsp:Transcript_1238/g.1805  ORF Transcript_1238/g.1805 Transcript_1238/m.1805 type:complete len:159 (+) Transcript_1238:170-646(+)
MIQDSKTIYIPGINCRSSYLQPRKKKPSIIQMQPQRSKSVSCLTMNKKKKNALHYATRKQSIQTKSELQEKETDAAARPFSENLTKWQKIVNDLRTELKSAKGDREQNDFQDLVTRAMKDAQLLESRRKPADQRMSVENQSYVSKTLVVVRRRKTLVG